MENAMLVQESYLILRHASKKLHVTFIVARNSTSAYFCALIHVLIRYFASGLDKCTLVYPGHLPWVFKLTSRFTTFAAWNSTSVYFFALKHVLIRYLASGLDKCTLVYAGHLPWVFKLTARFTTFVLYSLLAIVIKLNDTANWRS